MSVTTLPPSTDEAEEKPKSKKKLVMVVVLLMVVSAAAWWFLLKPAGAAPPPEPGEVVTMEPIQINLAGGHYLKIGIAIQATADAHEAPDGSKALDATIELFSGKPVEELVQPVQRQKLKAELLKELEEGYHHEVMDVYFTDFVTQ
ncbi:MAG: flagellar basal body-associated FliL family protein [Nocardioidaceae bacterium]|nr:flagellar basal body-associated FliL family protein [Nocardioidaceae bacterium]